MFPRSRSNSLKCAALGIRRNNDVRNDSVSLRRLLEEILKNNSLISKSKFICKYSKEENLFGENAFYELCGKKGVNVLPKCVIRKDISELKRASHTIRRLVDTNIAHLDSKNLKRKNPNYTDILDTVDLLNKLCDKYYYILYAIQPKKINIGESWKDIFKEAWIKNE